MQTKTSMFITQTIATLALIFIITINGYCAGSHIERCANRCAATCCGMSADTKVFHCIESGSQDKSGHIDFNLSDEDKMKLPNCFQLDKANATNPSNPAKFQQIEDNKKKFDRCLQSCKIELLNWCIP